MRSMALHGGLWCAIGVFGMGTCSAASAGELVFNGGFETGDFSGWSVPPFISNQQIFGVNGNGGHTGTHYASLSSTEFRYISQILPTTAGEDYELSFWLRRPSNFPAAFLVRWEGQVISYGYPGELPDSTHWFQFTVPRHSNITGSFLELGQNNFPAQFHLDDVSVRPVPAPGAASVLAIAGMALASRRRRGAA